MSSISVNTITDASGGATTSINGFTPSVSNMAGRNRIINGDMRIDQRNAGASVTPTHGSYTLDRWRALMSQNGKYSVQQNAGSVTPPAGFANYLGVTVLAATTVGAGDYFWLDQTIEGFNAADFNWGTADAAPVTLSFWVRSSLTGSFGGSVQSNGGFYPFSYSLPVANTWTFVTVSVPGTTAYSPPSTTNGSGPAVLFGLGVGSTYSGPADVWAGSTYLAPTGSVNVVGTSGATFYITGVQLEEGSVATPFCPAGGGSYGAELALCQRYYQKISLNANPEFWGTGYWNTTTGVQIYTPFITPMRAAPTALETSGVPSQYSVRYAGGRDSLSAGPTFGAATTFGINIGATSSAARTAGNGTIGTVEAATFLAWSAEL